MFRKNSKKIVKCKMRKRKYLGKIKAVFNPQTQKVEHCKKNRIKKRITHEYPQ